MYGKRVKFMFIFSGFTFTLHSTLIFTILGSYYIDNKTLNKEAAPPWPAAEQSTTAGRSTVPA
jgi:hypothetical protein